MENGRGEDPAIRDRMWATLPFKPYNKPSICCPSHLPCPPLLNMHAIIAKHTRTRSIKRESRRTWNSSKSLRLNFSFCELPRIFLTPETNWKLGWKKTRTNEKKKIWTFLCCSGDAQRQGREFAPRFALPSERVGRVCCVRPSSSRWRDVPAGEFSSWLPSWEVAFIETKHSAKNPEWLSLLFSK